MHKNRIMISTIPPETGGVPAMARFAADVLKEDGYEPVIVFYEPYSRTQHLSVPGYRLMQRCVKAQKTQAFEMYEAHAMGAWLPELEFTTYWPHRQWKQVMNSCDRHIAVSGNCLAALPYAQHGIPYLAWLATSWEGDRTHRSKLFAWYRKIIDQRLNAPIIRNLEKKILSNGRILALSAYTCRIFQNLFPKKPGYPILPMPIAENIFYPARQRLVPRRIGFSGRFNDPRKNIGLLLKAIKILNDAGMPATLELIGALPEKKLFDEVRSAGLSKRVSFFPYMGHETLRHHLQSFDLFVIPSFQEGLCISGIEAMACGCPVISTRCGGPEEFVVNDLSGYLVDFEPHQMAAVIHRVVSDRKLREKLSKGAIQLVRRHYDRKAAKRKFLKEVKNTFG
jgi:glycosyltransferase involved in cell wall biosynthesis